MPLNNNLFDKVDKDSEIITKNTDIIRKTFTSIIKTVDDEKHIVHAIVSDDSVDRYDEVIKAGAWEDLSKYKKHPVFVSSHNYGSLTCQIGIAERVWVENNKLHAQFKYFVGEGNQEADWGFKLAQKGAAAFSVGFIPLIHENEDIKGKNVKVYKKVELLEISQVLIPANASALQKGLDSDDPAMQLVAKCIKSVMDTELKIWEDADNEIKYRIKDPDKFQSDSFRTITIKKDKPLIYAISGKLTGENVMTLQALRFQKDDNWNLGDAKAWVKGHPEVKSIPAYILKSLLEFESISKRAVVGMIEVSKQIAADVVKIFDNHVKNIEIKHKRKTERDVIIDTSKQINKIMKKYKEVSNA